MNGKDFIYVMDYLSNFKAKAEKPVRRDRRKKREDDDLDLAETYLRLEAKAERIKKAKEQIEKMMKKEEKKEDKFELSTFQRAFLLVTAGPFIGVLGAGFVLKMIFPH